MSSTDIAFAYEPRVGAALRVPCGTSQLLVTHDRALVNAVINAALEFDAAADIRLLVLGIDPRTLDRSAQTALRARIGFMPPSGGLISNLNGWDNAVLPLGFYQPARLPDIAPQLLSLLDALVGGAPALLAKLPEDMSVLERKAIGFARALLLAPELMIVENFFLGIEPAERRRMDVFTAAYHNVCRDGSLLQIDHHQPI